MINKGDTVRHPGDGIEGEVLMVGAMMGRRPVTVRPWGCSPVVYDEDELEIVTRANEKKHPQILTWKMMEHINPSPPTYGGVMMPEDPYFSQPPSVAAETKPSAAPRPWVHIKGGIFSRDGDDRLAFTEVLIDTDSWLRDPPDNQPADFVLNHHDWPLVWNALLSDDPLAVVHATDILNDINPKKQEQTMTPEPSKPGYHHIGLGIGFRRGLRNTMEMAIAKPTTGAPGYNAPPDLIMTDDQWASLMMSVSALPETSENHQRFLDLHSPPGPGAKSNEPADEPPDTDDKPLALKNAKLWLQIGGQMYFRRHPLLGIEIWHQELGRPNAESRPHQTIALDVFITLLVHLAGRTDNQANRSVLFGFFNLNLDAPFFKPAEPEPEPEGLFPLFVVRDEKRQKVAVGFSEEKAWESARMLAIKKAYTIPLKEESVIADKVREMRQIPQHLFKDAMLYRGWTCTPGGFVEIPGPNVGEGQ